MSPTAMSCSPASPVAGVHSAPSWRRSWARRATQLSPLTAVTVATLFYTVAAERAAVHSSGPGSFAVAFLDELAATTAADLGAAASVEHLATPVIEAAS